MSWLNKIPSLPSEPMDRSTGSRRVAVLVVVGLCLIRHVWAVDDPSSALGRAWVDRLSSARSGSTSAGSLADRSAGSRDAGGRLEEELPIPCDWLDQDAGMTVSQWLATAPTVESDEDLVRRAVHELGTTAAAWRREPNSLSEGGAAAGAKARLELYVRACEQRRSARLQSLLQQSPKIVFTKHYNLGGSHYAYTEGQSDAQNERHFVPGSALCLLEMSGAEGVVRTLLESPQGVIRDPDVSWDGERILFAWKREDRQDDYHLYELEVRSSTVRQLTFGRGFADYEGVYLPNGDIVFNSTRCVQTVDCWWTEVSNLYTCGPNGEFLRRVTFDQVHDNYPTVLPDGRIVYTRWEYNDRGQIYVQGLFQMNPDGTAQSEFYGNNSWFPTTLLHARGIPGTQKVVAILTGHHTLQMGKLGIVDPALGRQENAGVQLIAPVRSTPADRIDAYGQEGGLYQYPYPISDSEFIVAMAPRGWSREPLLFRLYLVTADGRREWLAADQRLSCNQPVPLRPRPRPTTRPSLVDYRQTNGTVFMQDIAAGSALGGVPAGTVKKLRIIGLEYRAAGIGYNYNTGPAGDALVSTPISIGNGSWDVKVVLGETPVYSDGSAWFKVPARTPFYVQAIDQRGYTVQSMRSWATLQPGEALSCVGCHEGKNQAAPLSTGLSRAQAVGPQPLSEFYGPARGFSFGREIQPILDRHCIRCHHDADRLDDRLGGLTTAPAGSLAASEESGADDGTTRSVFSLRAAVRTEALAKRHWSESYLALVQARAQSLENNRYLSGGGADALIHWTGAQSVPDLLPPYFAGAARSQLLVVLDAGHHSVRLDREEMEKLACWIDLMVPFCGEYTEANAWSADEKAAYDRFREKRRQMAEEEARNIEALLRFRSD